jgi:Bacterial regulatory helix-turn-helix protein, lysR family
LTGAARQLLIDQPAISKIVAQLADRVGVKLLPRTTQGSCEPVSEVNPEVSLQAFFMATVLIRFTKCPARHLDVVTARVLTVRVEIPVGRMLGAEHEPVAGTPLAEP